jgi:hypothetical protein
MRAKSGSRFGFGFAIGMTLTALSNSISAFNNFFSKEFSTSKFYRAFARWQ